MIAFIAQLRHPRNISVNINNIVYSSVNINDNIVNIANIANIANIDSISFYCIVKAPS